MPGSLHLPSDAVPPDTGVLASHHPLPDTHGLVTAPGAQGPQHLHPRPATSCGAHVSLVSRLASLVRRVDWIQPVQKALPGSASGFQCRPLELGPLSHTVRAHARPSCGLGYRRAPKALLLLCLSAVCVSRHNPATFPGKADSWNSEPCLSRGRLGFCLVLRVGVQRRPEVGSHSFRIWAMCV